MIGRLRDIETILQGLERKLSLEKHEARKPYIELKIKYYLEKKLELIEQIERGAS